MTNITHTHVREWSGKRFVARKELSSGERSLENKE
jgi:hypothetical protein